tara:strand:- start:235 stop:336 length:102 start_codon:yes stop_codon:yes gene_type:complete
MLAALESIFSAGIFMARVFIFCQFGFKVAEPGA